MKFDLRQESLLLGEFFCFKQCTTVFLLLGQIKGGKEEVFLYVRGKYRESGDSREILNLLLFSPNNLNSSNTELRI